METDETPKTLQNDLLTSHVSHRINETNTIECELDEVTFLFRHVQVIASERFSILNLWLICLQNQRIGCLDMIVDHVARQDTTLALREVKAWKLIIHTLWVGLRIVNVKDTSCKSRSHFSTVVSIHSQWSALAQSLVSS